MLGWECTRNYSYGNGIGFFIKWKEILIKSIYQALVSCSIGVFKIPPISFHDLQCMLISWLWWANSDSRSIHWLFKPTKMGGLGFKDLKVFNKAMLSKACWHLIMCVTSFTTKVFKVKYFNDSWVFESW